MVDLMRGPVIRENGGKMEEENKGMRAMFEKSFCDSLSSRWKDRQRLK